MFMWSFGPLSLFLLQVVDFDSRLSPVHCPASGSPLLGFGYADLKNWGP